ncbi:MAG: MarR family transcriptional regulator [Pseudomonadota bacterium]
MKEIEADFIIQHARLTHKILRRADSQLNIHGISFSEYMLLYYLNEAPNNVMRRIDLAEAVGISASGVTRMLAPMEKIKLVEKEINPRDARVSLVKLSETGKTIFAEASVTFAHTAKSITHALTTEQLKKMLGFTSQLV